MARRSLLYAVLSGWAALIAGGAEPAPTVTLNVDPAVRWEFARAGNGHYYQAVCAPDGIKWDDAQSWAAAHGGYLATIGSPNENDFVFHLIDAPRFWSNDSGNSSGPLLGGIKDPGVAAAEQGWRWVNDGSHFTYTNWAAGEPDNTRGREDRVQFWVRGVRDMREPFWNDVWSGWTQKGFVVEYDQAPLSGFPEATSAAAVTATLDVLDAQTLAANEMADIVVIEGDQGVATGFVARIHGIDCVVTNLHVLVNNEKITVKDLTGAIMDVHGIIGAVGADIALLRLAKPNSAAPALVTADNVLQAAKIGDRVVVVGNLLGGGVATQVAGQVKGIGPDRVEIDAAFQPGNSGSPIFDVTSRQVIGVATFTHTLKVGSNGKTVDATDPNDRLETRWFGYRLDSVAKWETVDWTKWRDQARKVSEFRGNSIALWYAYTGNLPEAALNPRLRALIDRFESRTAGSASEQTADFIRSVRAYAADGEKDFANADYYDFFRTSLYWGTSVPGQVKYRDFLIQGFDEIADSLPAYLARLKK